MKRKARQSEEDAISKTASSKAEVKSVPQRPKSPVKTASKARPAERDVFYQPASSSVHYTDTSLPAATFSNPCSEEHKTGMPSLDLRQSQVASMAKPVNDLQNHKRKHAFFDDEELPSSSPPEMPSSSKRRRQSTAQERPIEIASTPERSPAPNADRSFMEHDGRLALDDVTTPEGFLDDEEDFEDIDTHFGRPLSQSLSSPERTAPPTRTQAVFIDPTQYIDFDVPPPEDGWSNDSAVSDPEFPTSSPPMTSTRGPEKPQLDTQALLTTKTQLPDFSIPEPSGGWDPSPSLSPPPEHHPASPTQSEITADLDAWIDARIAVGHTPSNVELALKSTSMDAELATAVLSHLRKGDGVPQEMRGVWTEEDDADLEATDARRLERLERKHGSKALGLRWEFLEVYKWG